MWFAPSLEVDGSYGGFGTGFGFDWPTVSVDIPNPPAITIGGGGSAREEAVRIVNWYEPQFVRNRDEYRAGRVSASRAQQTFQTLWSEMESLLSRLGTEGERALADRRPGGKFDWHRAYDYFAVGGSGITPVGSQPPVTGLPPTYAGLPPPGQEGGLSMGGLIIIGILAWLLFS
jgi:hypothetical protein